MQGDDITLNLARIAIDLLWTLACLSGSLAIARLGRARKKTTRLASLSLSLPLSLSRSLSGMESLMDKPVSLA